MINYSFSNFVFKRLAHRRHKKYIFVWDGVHASMRCIYHSSEDEHQKAVQPRKEIRKANMNTICSKCQCGHQKQWTAGLERMTQEDEVLSKTDKTKGLTKND